MKSLVALALAASLISSSAADIQLFDGKSFAGWLGDTNQTWRIQDGALAAGSLNKRFPRNEFLRSERQFTNFVLTLKVKLLGTDGFVNGGIQIRSQQAVKPTNEMVGYQCDVGAGWWGALYDESRRNKILIKPDPEAVKKAVKNGEWNDYWIKAEGDTVEIAINGVTMIRYTEPDKSLPQFGRIGLQIHGDGVTEIFYKDITIREL